MRPLPGSTASVRINQDETMTRTLTLLLALAAIFPTAHAQDVQRGSTKVQMCIGCHGIVGYQADFPQVYKVPKIAGQDAKYIASALTAYRSGDRKFPTMRSIAASLSDQDIADIAAYYAQLGKPEEAVPATLATPVPDKLRTALATCVSCHGPNFSTPTDGTIPRLAGQYADYLEVALKSYKTEKNNNVGRSNGVMAGQVKQFNNAELKAIASYISTLPTELATVPQGKFR